MHIAQSLAPGRCLNENFNWIVYRKFYKSIEYALSERIEFEFGVKKRIGKGVKFGKE